MAGFFAVALFAVCIYLHACIYFMRGSRASLSDKVTMAVTFVSSFFAFIGGVFFGWIEWANLVERAL